MEKIIGFDAKRANANRTGLGNYSRFVIDALASTLMRHSGVCIYLDASPIPNTMLCSTIPG